MVCREEMILKYRFSDLERYLINSCRDSFTLVDMRSSIMEINSDRETNIVVFNAPAYEYYLKTAIDWLKCIGLDVYKFYN